MIETRPDYADGAAFSEHKRIDPSVDFDYEAVEAALSGEAPNTCSTTNAPHVSMSEVERLRLVQAALRMLQKSTNNPTHVGRRVMIYFHMLTLQESQSTLAARMGLSTGRLSEVKTGLTNEFKDFVSVLIGRSEHSPIDEYEKHS